MIFRLGYVAMTLNLVDCSPSGTLTVSNYNKLPDDSSRIYKLRKITEKNLRNTLRILRYNLANNIKVYRFTSKLVPLATYPLTLDWDYTQDFKVEFREIGDFIKENNFRISAHPDHYTLINSKSKDVIKNSINDLDYHVRLFESMGIGDYGYKLVLHIGGLYNNKDESIERFKDNFSRLPDRISKRIILENDDKSYSAADVLGICNELRVPMVVDIHHHNCVNNGEKLVNLLPQIFDTWNEESFNPKIHFSSPKSPNRFRSHADDIDSDEFRAFLDIAKVVGRDFDVMIEAKNKDSALLKLSKDLEGMKGIDKINESKFKY